MLRFASIALILSIVGQASLRTAWALHYQLNRAAYLARCVNKDKPALHCDGKCAFMQQIKAREKSKEPQLPKHFREIKDIQLFFDGGLSLPNSSLPDFSEAERPSRCAMSVAAAPPADIFKPPA
jgi:hypothetical protein